jgi:hypothetical protein
MREESVLSKWKIPTITLGFVALIGWRNAQSADPRIGVSTQEALAIGTNLHTYGHLIVTMEMIRRVMIDFSPPGDRRAPIGQFALMQEYPPASFREVTAPNADTLHFRRVVNYGTPVIYLQQFLDKGCQPGRVTAPPNFSAACP